MYGFFKQILNNCHQVLLFKILAVQSITCFSFQVLLNFTSFYTLLIIKFCIRYTNTFSKTIPLAWEDPWKGLTHLEGKWAFLQSLSCHFWSRLWLTHFLAVFKPLGLPVVIQDELSNSEALELTKPYKHTTIKI